MTPPTETWRVSLDGKSLGDWPGETPEDAVLEMLMADSRWEELHQQMRNQPKPKHSMAEVTHIPFVVERTPKC